MKLNKSISTPFYLAAALGLASILPLMASAESTTKLNEELTHGSIQVTKATGKTDFIRLATLTQEQAAAAALAHTPGKVIESELTTENGFLVWEVKLAGQQGGESELYVDAGTGEVLAIEQEESEYDDDDEGERG